MDTKDTRTKHHVAVTTCCINVHCRCFPAAHGQNIATTRADTNLVNCMTEQHMTTLLRLDEPTGNAPM